MFKNNLIMQAFILMLIATVLAASNDCGNKLVLKSPGDVILIGLFDLHFGPDCNQLSTVGQLQIKAAETTLEWINNASDINMGFIALDTCSRTQTAIEQIIYGLIEAEYTNHCSNSKLLGFLGPSSNRINWKVLNFLKSLSVPYLPIRITQLYSEIQVLISLLVHFDWLQVALLTVSDELEVYFLQIASTSNICVTVSNVLKNSRNEYDNFILRLSSSSTHVIVVLGTEVELIETIHSANFVTDTSFYWLAAGMMSQNIQMKFGKFTDSIRSLIIVEMAESNSIQYPNDHLDPSVQATVNGVLAYYSVIMTLKDTDCNPEENICLTLFEQLNNLFTERSNKELRDFSPNIKIGNLTLWSYRGARQRNGIQFYQVGQYVQDQLNIDTKKLDILQSMGDGWFKIPHFRCDNCVCENAEIIGKENQRNVTYRGIWRTDTWVTVCVTIASIGILVALSVLIFIVCRICSGEPVEGHHGFASLSLIGIVVLYATVFPYAFKPTEIVCALRVSALGFGYAAVFSPAVARCLMLATSNSLGLVGHINGIIQMCLYGFITGIQAALSAQYWWLNWGNHLLHGPYQRIGCHINQTTIVTTLVYDMVLLVFWLFLSPFCIKIRRNYREGLLFHLTSLITFVVWIIWFTLYFVFDLDWTEPVLCSGMVITATIVLVIVFLPRVYNIATAVSRNSSKLRLRSLDQLTCSIHTNSISRNLYSSVKNTYVSESNSEHLKDERGSIIYDDTTLAAVTHL